MHLILVFNSFTWEIEGIVEKQHDHTITNEEARKDKKCENMRKLREKRAMEINVEALGGDEEMQNVNLAHGGKEGMQIVEELVDERNEEHGGDEEMQNLEQTMGSVNIETMIGE